MRWVTATQLENWARTLAAREELPKIVADLIRASSSDIVSMRFPSGDKGQVRGFDGHLVSDVSALNVPHGRSFWEFGTDADYKRKAESSWKHILYIDGSALETWLEHRPAVSAWHARTTLQLYPVERIRSTD